MRIERVTVGFGSTIGLPNYSSLRLDVELEARVEDGDDPFECARQLHADAVAEVRRQARERMKGQHADEGGRLPEDGAA